MKCVDDEKNIGLMSDDGGSGSFSKELKIESICQKSFPEDHPDTSSSNSYCQATCYLAIARYYNPRANITMSDLQKLPNPIVRSDGYLYWGNSNNRYFTDGQQVSYHEATDKNKVIAAINSGYPVIMKGKNYGYDHFVVVYGYSGNYLKIMDPWEGKKYNLGSGKFKSPSHIRICKP